MTQKMLRMILGLGMFGVMLLAADAAFGGGTAFGIGFGGGGGGIYLGGYSGGHQGGGYHDGYHGGHYGGSGVAWGVNVPLSSDGSVQLGVGSGGYHSPYYHRYDYPHGGYYQRESYNYQGSSYNYRQPSAEYAESTPAAAPEPPPLPTAGEVRRMSDEQLAGLLGMASDGYSRELGDYKNGETWQKYFKLAEIIEIVKTKSNPPDAASRTTLVEVLKRMDSAAQNAQYETITNCWGFKAIQTGLREYTLLPKQRSAHLLESNLQRLSATLDGITSGEGWKKHLQIEELEKLVQKDAAGDAPAGELGQPRPQPELRKILAKFDAVAGNPQYQVIAELDGFTATQAGLQRYQSAMQAERPVPPPPPPALDTARSF
jgi:hypothetical protein